jgi:uncharacterized protein (TIGR03083 family)
MDSTTSAELYRATRERVTATVRGLDPADLGRQVPACPEWTVHNLVSHLAGVAADFAVGNVDGAPRPPWTSVQVDARRSMPMDAILDEWAETGPALERVILGETTSNPLVCNPWVDSGTHEADLHGALGTGQRPPSALWIGTLDWLLSDPPSEGVQGSLSIVTPDGTYQLGSGDPVAEARTSSYELFRAVFGRRSDAQVRSWTWSSPEHADLWSPEIPHLQQTDVALTD